MEKHPRRGQRLLDENLVAELVTRRVINDTFRRLRPEKKSRLYQEAVRLFGEYGYDGLAVDQYCEETNISKGSFFQYFPSKSHLLEFAILTFDDFLAQWVKEIRLSETGPLARQRLLHLYQSLSLNTRLFPDEEKFYLMVTRGLYHAAVILEGVDIERHFREYIIEIIQRGERAREIRGDFDVRLTGQLVALVIEALVTSQYVGQRIPRKRAEEYLISFLFDGVKA